MRREGEYRATLALPPFPSNGPGRDRADCVGYLAAAAGTAAKQDRRGNTQARPPLCRAGRARPQAQEALAVERFERCADDAVLLA